MRQLLTDLRGNPIYTSFGSWRSGNGNNGSSSRNDDAPHHNPLSILFLHVKSSDWNSTISRAKSHPPEILMVDDNGNTPLHIACQLDPPADVLFHLKEAVTQTNSWGATPLHIAASHRCNAKALKKLIDYFPGALCRFSRMHRTPIHYACMSYRGLDLVAFQVLLEQTLAESRRLKEEQQQQQQQNNAQGTAEFDLKINDFIDILREAKDDIEGDDILDDEEISVLVLDSDSEHAVAATSSGSLSSSLVQTRLTDSNQLGEGENSSNGPNKNNYNVVTWKDTTGKTPLGLLFRRYRERVKRVIEVLEQMKNSATTSPRSSSSLQTDLGHLWGKARLIVVRLTEEHKYQQQQQQHQNQEIFSAVVNSLQGRKQIGTAMERDDDSSASGQHWLLAASWSKERLSNNARYKDSNELKKYKDSNKLKDDNDFGDKKVLPIEERQFRIVHASVGLAGYGCPPEMIRLAISIYPHQVREMDEDGNLPLHIAATASSFGTHTSANSIIDEEFSVFSDSIVSLFSAASSKKNGDGNSSNASFDKVIKLLLKQYPHAAQTPHGRSGRLPLVLADRAGHRTWNDGMKTLLRAYPPALFSGSKGMVPVKLYPHVLSLIGGGDPPESSQTNCASVSNCASTNTMSSLHRSCYSNRFKGHGGIGLLHNLLLLKQRHMRELMAGTTGISSTGRRQPSRNLVNHDGITRSEDNSQITSRYSSRSSSYHPPKPSKTNGRIRSESDKKKRKELATTMYELLRAKPDLIEASRSHQVNSKSDFRKTNSINETMPLEAAISIPNSAHDSYYSHHPEGPQGQRLSRGRKKTTSRNLLERMRVFERKAWKSV